MWSDTDMALAKMKFCLWENNVADMVVGMEKTSGAVSNGYIDVNSYGIDVNCYGIDLTSQPFVKFSC